MSAAPVIRPAGPADAAALLVMLTQLAADLGDTPVFASTEATIRAHGFGADALFHTLIAGEAEGFALFFRHYSTTRGQPGVYVQDLWIAPARRGQQLGERLLAAVAGQAAAEWGARYLMLSVHRDNPRAAHFYRRLGFHLIEEQAPMVLDAAGFATLAKGVQP